MHDPDIISGKQVINTIKQLQKDRTILRINILGTGFEGLTVITGIINHGAEPGILIDYPGGADDSVLYSYGKGILFEFRGKDKIHYRFKSVISEVREDGIKIEPFKSIERIQRRKHFRVDTPAGTMMIFDRPGKKYEFNVINLSEGGALISLKASLHNKILFDIGERISNLFLKSEENNLDFRINIKDAEILRTEKSPETGRYNYAIKFLNIDKERIAEVREFIYQCQRIVLKKRSYFWKNSIISG